MKPQPELTHSNTIFYIDCKFRQPFIPNRQHLMLLLYIFTLIHSHQQVGPLTYSSQRIQALIFGLTHRGSWKWFNGNPQNWKLSENMLVLMLFSQYSVVYSYSITTLMRAQQTRRIITSIVGIF